MNRVLFHIVYIQTCPEPKRSLARTVPKSWIGLEPSGKKYISHSKAQIDSKWMDLISSYLICLQIKALMRPQRGIKTLLVS